jgi:hypothetical protein
MLPLRLVCVCVQAGDDGGHEGLAAEESQATTAFLGLPMPPGGGGGGAGAWVVCVCAHGPIMVP